MSKAAPLSPRCVRGFRMSREEAAGWVRAAEQATMDVRVAWHEYKYMGPLYAERVATASRTQLLEWSDELIYDGNPPEMVIGALLLAAARGDGVPRSGEQPDERGFLDGYPSTESPPAFLDPAEREAPP